VKALRDKIPASPGLSRGRLFLAQRANIDRYPPVLNQLRILTKSFDSTVLDRVSHYELERLETSPEVQRLRIRAQAQSRRFTTIRGLRDVWAFARIFRHQLARRPHIAIAYDADAAALLLRSSTAPFKRVVHLHELPDASTGGRANSLSTRYLLSNLNRADLIVVPDAERARIVSRSAGLLKEPVVVMNCPALLKLLPSSKLLPELDRRGVHTKRIVHYQGAVGPEHHLDLIVSSMKHWPSDAVFVVVGGGTEEYVRHLQACALSIGVEDRLIFLGLVPYSDVLSYAVGATVGLSFLEPTSENWQYSAGASNKRFEYAALGIAQVTNAGPGMFDIFGKPGIALLISHLSAESIGSAICELLLRPTIATEIGKRARTTHLNSYNYERQFAPVVERLESWLRDEP
jgi:glycosyltransferase involved in cell wall biosynthesis